MADSEQVKAALTALAEGEVASDDGGTTAAPGWDDGSVGPPAVNKGGADYRSVIEQAIDATGDLDAAVAFVDAHGIDRLETAVAQAEHEVSGLADEGRTALRAFRRYRDAAAGADAEL